MRIPFSGVVRQKLKQNWITPLFVIFAFSMFGMGIFYPKIFSFKAKATENERITIQVNRARKGAPLDNNNKGQLLPTSARPAQANHIVPKLAVPQGSEHALSMPTKKQSAKARVLKENVPIIPLRLALSKFYLALSKLESGTRKHPVTILHLGDDHIAMDRFSGDLRKMFLGRFGNAGRGLLMPAFPFPFYRAKGTLFRRTGSWQAASSLAGQAGPYGLTGVKMISGASKAQLTLASTQGTFSWGEVTLLAGPKQGKALVTIENTNGQKHQIVSMTSRTQGIKRVRIEHLGTRLTVQARTKHPITVLSWAIGNNTPGVRYVSLGVPGASADLIQRWDAALVSDEMRHLNPDLIVLSYGTHEGFDDNLDVSGYEKRFSKLIRVLKTFAPNASLAVIGPPDAARLPLYVRRLSASTGGQHACRALSAIETKNYKRKLAMQDPRLGRWHPPPMLDTIRHIYRRVAAKSGAFFWDWSKVMGGPCGIHAWVHASPQLASNDHIRLTDAGAERSAQNLFSELMAGLAAYRRLARK